jgi:murein L,D-transpeptidase YcbB/YkuD
MIDTVLARNKKHSILLKRPIPVHVCYVTVWKGRDGSVQFREDCYGLDKQLGEVLLSKRR